MDFFVSKVAMSICALLVVAVLGGAVDEDRFLNEGRELRSVIEDFCEVADDAMEAGLEGTVSWTVPKLSSGEPLQLEIEHDWTRGSMSGHSMLGGPHCTVHTWTWDGTALNKSAVDSLDEASAGLRLSSGDAIVINTIYVLVDNDQVLMAFVSPGPG